MPRQRLTDAQKAARGTLQPCRASGKSPIVSIDELKAPAWLPYSAKKIFKDKTRTLAAYGALTVLDVDNLALYSYAMDTCVDCIRHIEAKDYKEFTPVEDKHGNLVKYVENPYRQRLLENLKVVNKIGNQYGFSPSSRATITKMVQDKENVDEFDEFEEL